MTTTPSHDTDLLHRTVRGWNLLRLEWVRRTLCRLDPTGIGARRTGELCDALEVAGAAADPVLVDPRFGRWCAELVSLLDRDAPSLLPGGRFRASCREAGAFTLAAHFLHMRSDVAGAWVPATIVRVDHDGRVHLPGTGHVLVLEARYVGLDLPIDVRDGLFARADGRLPELAATTEQVAVPGLAVPDGDPVDLGTCAVEPLLMTSPPSVVVERGAFDPRGVSVPGIARVPAEAPSVVRARHALAAAAHLRAAVLEGELFESGVAVADPPPEVAYIANAPQLVRLLALYGPPDLLGHQFEYVGRVLNLAAEWLAAGSLSSSGEDLRRKLAESGFPTPAAGQGHAAKKGGQQPKSTQAWRATWVDAGGAFRDPSPRSHLLTVENEDLARLMADLGAANGIEVNSISDGRPRADPTIDHLGLVKVRDPARYAAMVRRLATPPRCPAEEILFSHHAYVEGRFSEAAAGYAELLLQLPHDIDLWRDFAFTLRHLGATELCETAVFRLADVVDRAVACVLDLVILQRLRPDSGRWRNASRAVQLLVGLIEWTARDPDPR